MGEDALLVLRIINYLQTRSFAEGRKVPIQELVKYVHRLQKNIHTKKEMQQRYTEQTLSMLLDVIQVRFLVQAHWQRQGKINTYEYSMVDAFTIIPEGVLRYWRKHLKRVA
ncbi:MAG TPA: hypothetical protein VI757_12080 [Bacteroidia bacterium]|nr:hypothetical protein [Bacteroidia bacterium]